MREAGYSSKKSLIDQFYLSKAPCEKQDTIPKSLLAINSIRQKLHVRSKMRLPKVSYRSILFVKSTMREAGYDSKKSLIDQFYLSKAPCEKQDAAPKWDLDYQLYLQMTLHNKHEIIKILPE